MYENNIKTKKITPVIDIELAKIFMTDITNRKLITLSVSWKDFPIVEAFMSREETLNQSIRVCMNIH